MARQPGFIRDEIMMALGLALAGFGGLGLLGFFLDEDKGTGDWIGGLVLVLLILGGGIALFVVGLRFRRLEQRLRRLLRVMRSVDSCPVPQLARTAGMTPEQARQGVVFLIGRGFIAARFDPGRDVVVSPEAERGGGAWLRLPGSCPNCHAPTPTLIPACETPECEYCAAPLPAQRVESEDKQEMARAMVPARGAGQLEQTVFSGSWVVLVVLFIVFWPAAVAYLMRGLNGQSSRALFRG